MEDHHEDEEDAHTGSIWVQDIVEFSLPGEGARWRTKLYGTATPGFPRISKFRITDVSQVDGHGWETLWKVRVTTWDTHGQRAELIVQAPGAPEDCSDGNDRLHARIRIRSPYVLDHLRPQDFRDILRACVDTADAGLATDAEEVGRQAVTAVLQQGRLVPQKLAIYR